MEPIYPKKHFICYQTGSRRPGSLEITDPNFYLVASPRLGEVNQQRWIEMSSAEHYETICTALEVISECLYEIGTLKQMVIALEKNIKPEALYRCDE